MPHASCRQDERRFGWRVLADYADLLRPANYGILLYARRRFAVPFFAGLVLACAVLTLDNLGAVTHNLSVDGNASPMIDGGGSAAGDGTANSTAAVKQVATQRDS